MVGDWTNCLSHLKPANQISSLPVEPVANSAMLPVGSFLFFFTPEPEATATFSSTNADRCVRINTMLKTNHDEKWQRSSCLTGLATFRLLEKCLSSRVRILQRSNLHIENSQTHKDKETNIPTPPSSLSQQRDLTSSDLSHSPEGFLLSYHLVSE